MMKIEIGIGNTSILLKFKKNKTLVYRHPSVILPFMYPHHIVHQVGGQYHLVRPVFSECCDHQQRVFDSHASEVNGLCSHGERISSVFIPQPKSIFNGAICLMLLRMEVLMSHSSVGVHWVQVRQSRLVILIRVFHFYYFFHIFDKAFISKLSPLF